MGCVVGCSEGGADVKGLPRVRAVGYKSSTPGGLGSTFGLTGAIA